MDIGEAIAVDVTLPSTEGPCWYCKKEAEGEKKNKETDDPKSAHGDPPDKIPENNEDNLSALLGTALKESGDPAPNWVISNPSKPDAPTTVVPAAHHCIPGEASLAKATELHKFMRK